MASLIQRKQAIVDFIIKHFTVYDFERSNSLNNGDDGIYFGNYDELIEYQRKALEPMSEGQIASLEMLILMIPTMNNMDKESMVVFETSGFVFNKNAKIVIFNER